MISKLNDNRLRPNRRQPKSKPINIIFDKVFNFILILVPIDFLDNMV